MVKKTIYFDVMLKSSDRINLNDFKARQKVMTNDKNSVDIVFRATDVEPNDLKGATASIFLYMQDGSFFQSNSVVITGNILTYTMTQNQTQHKGTTKVQIVVKSGTIDNASLLQEFEISPGLEKYPLTEVMIQDWTSLTAEAKVFVDQIEGFTLESFVENKMGEELANLETNYATRLTGLEQKDNQLTAQLAHNANELETLQTNKAEKVYTDGKLDLKRDKSIKIASSDLDTSSEASKIKLVNLSEEVQQAMAGTAPVIATVEDGTITREKYADKSVASSKLSPSVIKNYNAFDRYVNGYIETTGGILPPITVERVAIAEIEAGKSYKVVTDGTNNRFRIALSNTLFTGTAIEGVLLVSNNSIIQYEFTNTANYKYAYLYLSNTGSEPKVTISNGDDLIIGGFAVLKKDDKITSNNIPDNSITIEKVDFVDDRTNMFDGVYRNDLAINVHDESSDILSTTNASMAVFAIDAGQYAIQTVGSHNRFTVALSNSIAVGDVTKRLIQMRPSIGNESYIADNTSGAYKYLLVYVSNQSEEPNLYVYKGTEIKQHDQILIKGYELLLNELNSVSGENLKDNSIPKSKLGFEIAQTNGVYRTTLSTDTPMASHTDVYVQYDDLLSAYPDYVTMNVLGVDALGNEIREYVFKTPNFNSYAEAPRTQDSPIAKPKVLITTGIHGYERSPVIGVYKFFKELCENSSMSKINILRNAVEFRILPTCVPSAYDADSRLNHNGVNIVRNFTYGWVYSNSNPQDYSGLSASSEKETQILETWFNNHLNCAYYIDWHNTGYTDLEITMLGASVGTPYERKIKDSYFKFLNKIAQHWQNDFNIPTNRNLGYTGSFEYIATAQRHANSLGIPSMTLEISWQMPNDIKYGPITNAMATETMGNLAMELCKDYID